MHHGVVGSRMYSRNRQQRGVSTGIQRSPVSGRGRRTGDRTEQGDGTAVPDVAELSLNVRSEDTGGGWLPEEK